MSFLTATVDGVDQEGIKAGLKADCKVMLKTDGKTSWRSNGLDVSKASTATLYVVAATNFVNYHDISGNAEEKNKQTLDALEGLSYKTLLKRHVKKYQEQYDRVSLVLSKNSRNSNLPTDQRLAAF